jgi:hypothetical protein
MLSNTLKAENSAPCWNSTPKRCRSDALARDAAAEQRLAEELDAAAIRQQQADHLAQQRRLAAAGTADQRHQLAARHFKIQAVVDPDLAESGSPGSRCG